jgi:hypothetical protein
MLREPAIARGQRAAKKSFDLLCAGTEVTYRVVTHLQQEAVSVSDACRVLQVSRSGYYAHRRARPSARRLQEQTHVKAAFAASGASYGSRRVMHALREQGLWSRIFMRAQSTLTS